MLVLNLHNTGTFVVVVIVLPSSGSALQLMASPHVTSIEGKFFTFTFRLDIQKHSRHCPIQQMNHPHAYHASRASHGPRAHWDTLSTRTLLELTIKEKDKFNFSNQGLTRDGWRNVYHGLREANITWSKRQAHNKLNSLKDKFNV